MSIPENAGRPLTEAEQAEIIARSSPLTEYVYLSVNADFPREDTIKKITIHHMADDIPLERLGEVFAEPDRRASSNYAIDTAGRVALYVEEGNRAWTSSSPENDHQAVTIEVANDEIGGE
ncbi:MAG: N-acetylmuramoyl-L-alanine amidase, partial [Oscillibacter sp.]|nr:N-acetylmuramoyl-L-alanine amidase [Oscillibacter sp.]